MTIKQLINFIETTDMSLGEAIKTAEDTITNLAKMRIVTFDKYKKMSNEINYYKSFKQDQPYKNL